MLLWTMLFCFGLVSRAQDKLILVTQGGLGYTSQTWFYSGEGNELQQAKIKSNWDEGRRITSAAHTAQGWFVTMAKNTGITAQVYHYGSDWPSDWLKQKENEGYYLTTIASNHSKWFIVLSKGVPYTAQRRFGYKDWSENAERIRTLWNEDYYITQATYTGDKWYIVMSKNCGYTTQGYLWADSAEELTRKIDARWDEKYNLTLLEYGDGAYFAVYSKFAENNDVAQSYKVTVQSPSDFIDEQWESGSDIAYVGGGYEEERTTTYASNATSSTTTPSTTTETRPAGNDNDGNSANNGRSWRQTLPNGGYCDYVMQPDGSCTTTTVMPCLWCHGAKTCSICHGTGGVMGYGGVWYPFSSCAGTRICRNCNGTGTTTLVSTIRNGMAVGYDNNGQVYTSGGGAFGGSYDGSSSSSSSSSSYSGSSSTTNNQKNYIDVIEYAPNYTGEDNSVWCPTCGKIAPRHVHIKKRY